MNKNDCDYLFIFNRNRYISLKTVLKPCFLVILIPTSRERNLYFIIYTDVSPDKSEST